MANFAGTCTNDNKGLLLLLSCCCHFVALWSFCHYNKFLVQVNISGNKAYSRSVSFSQKWFPYDYEPKKTLFKNGLKTETEMIAHVQ